MTSGAKSGILFKSWFIGIFILILLLTVASSDAQTRLGKSELPPLSYDSNYIADYTDVLTARLFLLFQNASILINPAENKISRIVYRPNINVRIGIAGFWKWFGLGLSIDNPFYKTDQTAYGKTSSLDLRVNAFGREVVAELFLQNYKGFYIVSPERPDGTHYILQDMKSFSLGITGYWIYNSDRFSIRASFIQNERQKKSAGSLVIRPSFLYYTISSDQGIIPTDIINEFGILPANFISRGEFYSVALSPGYIYTLVFLKHFYITAAVFPGVAAQFASFSNEINEYYKFEFSFHLNSRFALGYNSDKWFLGASVQTGFNEVPDQLNNALSTYTLAQFRFWGGTRFNIFKKKKHVVPIF